MDQNTKIEYRDKLQEVANEIVTTVLKKDKEYGASWKRRGGVGAYMMLVRKSDRLEQQVLAHGYDIFSALNSPRKSKTIESLRDTLEDQIAYGLLILAEIRVRDIENQKEECEEKSK